MNQRERRRARAGERTSVREHETVRRERKRTRSSERDSECVSQYRENE